MDWEKIKIIKETEKSADKTFFLRQGVEAFVAVLGIADWWLRSDEKGLIILAVAISAMFAGVLNREMKEMDKIREK